MSEPLDAVIVGSTATNTPHTENEDASREKKQLNIAVGATAIVIVIFMVLSLIHI